MSSLKDKTLLLLGFLSHEQMHGYKLNQLLKLPSNSIQVGKANAYKILAKFEEQGFVTHVEESQRNRPSKTTYSITEAGKIEFKRLLLERLGEYQPFEYPDGVSLDFLALIEPQEALPLLLKRQECLAARCTTLQSYSDDIRTGHPGLNFLTLQAELEFEMLTKLIENLKGR
ncbi:MAG: helix-turn-helix transcriptional regulator [Leptospirales bacterium]